MSGIYLTVRDTERPFDAVLRSTKGGTPHITLVHGMKKLSREDLAKVGSAIFDELLKSGTRFVTLERARVNSFETDDGDHRHDVLLDLDEESKKFIEELRDRHVRQRFDAETVEALAMRPPHVTADINAIAEQAVKRAAFLNDTVLPMEVKLTGVNW